MLFYFDVRDDHGQLYPDDEGQELPDVQAARLEATEAAVAIAADVLPARPLGVVLLSRHVGAVVVEVLDEAREPLLTVKVELLIAPSESPNR